MKPQVGGSHFEAGPWQKKTRPYLKNNLKQKGLEMWLK
jgi:hypothetical protein